MHQQYHEQEQPVSPPVNSQTSSEPQQEITESESQSTAEFEAQLAALQKYTRRHAWFGGTFSVLAIMLGTVLTVFLFTMLSAAIAPTAVFPGANIILDWNPFSFGISHLRTIGAQGVAHTTSISGLTPLLLLFGCGYFATRSRKERHTLTRLVAQYDDIRAVGLLTQSLYLRDMIIPQEAAAALSRLLPRLKPEDTHLLNADQRLLLRLYLGRSVGSRLPHSKELTVAILKAFAQIGNREDIYAVRRIAAGKTFVGDPEIVAEAKACLETIKRRQAQEQAGKILLRASDPPVPNGETLLRPAETATETAPSELLRPINPNTGSSDCGATV